MRKKRTKPSQIIAGSLASIIFVQSCSKPSISYYDDEDVVAINLLDKDYENNMLLPIEIKLDSQLSSYFDFLNELAEEIINNPETAQQFLASPTEYMDNHGYSNLTISLDESLLNMVLCYADEELIEAIKKNDVELFVRICNSKGYIKSISESNLEIVRSILSSNEEFVKYLDSLESNGVGEKGAQTTAVAFTVAIAIGAAVAIWAGAVTHVLIGNVTVVGTVHDVAAATTYVWKGNEAELNNGMPNNSELIKIWLLKGGDASKCDMITNQHNEIFVEQLIDVIKSEIPEKAEQCDMDFVRNTLKLNLNMMSYGKTCN